MPFRKILSVIRTLLTPAIARRGAVFSTLVLMERLLFPVAAWSFFRRGLSEQIVLGFVLAAVFTSRTFVQHAFRARTEADLLERVASRLIGGDVLRAAVLRDEDPRAELGQAMFHTAQNVAIVLPLLLADALAAPVLMVVLIASDPARLLGLAAGTAVAVGAMMFVARRSIEAALANAWTAQQDAFMCFLDAAEGRLEVVASGRRAAFLAEMHDRAAAWARAGVRIAAGALVTGKLPMLSIAAIVAVLIAFAGTRAQAPTGVTTAEIALLASMTPAFSGVVQDLFALARTERWMAVVSRVLGEPPLGLGGSRPAPRLPAPIAFERVSFSYEGARGPALREVSFRWDREHILALTGANGSGKSTCFRMLLALAKPQSGAISVGGQPLDEFDADAWRRTIAFLPQRPYLPPAAGVGAAVRFLAPQATDYEIRHALERAGLSAALTRFGENPLAVRIGALSAGQRQRVGVARLLCQPASLVLLDEPDANLDRAGMALMVRLVRELAEHKMVALIAHSADLLEVADRVLTFEDGCLVSDSKSMRTSGQHRSRSPG